MAIEVTGSTLIAENLKTVPAAVTVFSYAQLQGLGFDSLGELMTIVPGFQSYRSTMNSFAKHFSSRGRRNSIPSVEVLVLMDGQRLNEPRASGSPIIVPAIQLANIERVEFIRGPGAALYGSNAMLGVINIITRKDANEVNIAFGTNSHRHIHAISSFDLANVNIDIFARYDNDTGQTYQVKDTYSPEQVIITDPLTFFDVNLKLRWHDTQLNIQHNSAKSSDFYSANRISHKFNQFEADFSYISFKQNINWSTINAWLWLSYSESSYFSHIQLTPKGALAPISQPTSDEPLHGATTFEDREVRLQWHNNWEVNSQSSLQFGFEYRHIDVPNIYASNNFDLEALSQGNYPIQYYGENSSASTIVEYDSQRNVFGAYSQYSAQPYKNSHLTLSLRYDDFSQIGSKVSPRIAWTQELNEQQSIKLIYGEAFRAPSESELNLVNNPTLLGNPHLQPETVESIDLIWFSQWSAASLSIGYFENSFKDSIIQVHVKDSLLQYQNISAIEKTRGLEFELKYEVNDHLLVQAAYTKFIENSDSSFREADQLASLSINYHQDNWNANIVASFHDNRAMLTDTGERKSIDQYWHLAGKINYLFATQWQGYLTVKNLTDKAIITPSLYPLSQTGTPNRGREVMLGVEYQF
ncbi:MAG: TonB-dependent receptor [Colwellia sp.]